MTHSKFMAPVLLAASTLSLGACADNYAGEGALAGAGVGAATSVLTGSDLGTSVAAGAAVGAAGGYFVDKDDDCDGYGEDGRLDDDCYGTAGYPVDPR